MLPTELPKCHRVYYYFRLWRNDGTWQRLHDNLCAKVRQQAGRQKQPNAECLNSQSIKTTAIAGVRGFDGAKQIKGRKRHLLIDTLGFLLVVVVTAASLPERDGARLLFARLTGSCKKLRRIWVDGGYRGPFVQWVAERFRFVVEVVL